MGSRATEVNGKAKLEEELRRRIDPIGRATMLPGNGCPVSGSLIGVDRAEKSPERNALSASRD
jgi:hypothetical protein